MVCLKVVPFKKIIILSEVSQTERQTSYDITYMWNLKNKRNELMSKQKQETLRRSVVTMD